jgi:hypothetical protein
MSARVVARRRSPAVSLRNRLSARENSSPPDVPVLRKYSTVLVVVGFGGIDRWDSRELNRGSRRAPPQLFFIER